METTWNDLETTWKRVKIFHITPSPPHPGPMDAFLTPYKSTTPTNKKETSRKHKKRCETTQHQPSNESDENSKCAICLKLGASWRPDMMAQVLQPASEVQAAYHPYCIREWILHQAKNGEKTLTDPVSRTSLNSALRTLFPTTHTFWRIWEEAKQSVNNNAAADADEPLGKRPKRSVTSTGEQQQSAAATSTGLVCTICNYSPRPHCKNPEEAFRKHKKRCVARQQQQPSPLPNVQSSSTQFLHVCTRCGMRTNSADSFRMHTRYRSDALFACSHTYNIFLYIIVF